MSNCVFCRIIAGTEPADIVREWPDAVAFAPLGPVVPDGHVLVVPRRHVADAIAAPAVTAATMLRAAEFAAEHDASNILTSVGRAATQSVFHLHLHVIRRTPGDGLMVPWGTTGNPQDPHSCTRAETAEAKRDGWERLYRSAEIECDELRKRLAENGEPAALPFLDAGRTPRLPSRADVEQQASHVHTKWADIKAAQADRANGVQEREA